jgi:hypothetical protein
VHAKNLVTGGLYTGFGLLTAVLASGYRMGTPVAMGPGFFPFWLGVALAVIGAILVVKSSRGAAVDGSTRLESWDLRSLSIVSASVILFGIALPVLGLMVSTALLVLVSSFASREFSLKVTLINVIILLAITYVVFVLGLGLQIPVWPVFF